ncbi:hypothetical protein BG261_04280 [Floricoccus tropicus]|uniref:Uncharacterized protein n=1 Tax=Floricoccus tropicus TaxID=1859473 RepID=A0A1E8GLN4_9LACT|nr:hypothetical protein [Floricoccus tropicus]OFI49097.1 hypothetical protein BG261_04280 [Floricoccus tropicus]
MIKKQKLYFILTVIVLLPILIYLRTVDYSMDGNYRHIDVQEVPEYVPKLKIKKGLVLPYSSKDNLQVTQIKLLNYNRKIVNLNNLSWPLRLKFNYEDGYFSNYNMPDMEGDFSDHWYKDGSKALERHGNVKKRFSNAEGKLEDIAYQDFTKNLQDKIWVIKYLENENYDKVKLSINNAEIFYKDGSSKKFSVQNVKVTIGMAQYYDADTNEKKYKDYIASLDKALKCTTIEQMEKNGIATSLDFNISDYKYTSLSLRFIQYNYEDVDFNEENVVLYND